MDLPQSQNRSPGFTAGGGIGRRAGELSPGLGANARAGLLLLAALLIGLFATAGRLTPDPRGYGTHEQLGLSPCAILRLTGEAVPDVRHDDVVRLVRPGRARPIVAGQPGGSGGGIGIRGADPWLLALAAGRPAGRRRVGSTLMALAVVAAALTVLAWLVRRSLSLI